MTGSKDRQVEAVIINWKRPHNVAQIVQALRKQSVPCTITVCDCHDSPEFALSAKTLSGVDRVYSWTNNLGSFSRFVPIGAYDHEYTFFIDDDMLPGVRCIEHFLAWAEYLRAFGALGQLGRLLGADGAYRSKGVARSLDFTEVDILIRSYFIKTSYLTLVPQVRALLKEFNDPEEDILLSVGLALHTGLPCYLTPVDPDPEARVNLRELDTSHARAHRPHHFQTRSRLIKNAMGLGWKPVKSRPGAEPAHDQGGLDQTGLDKGVLYLALGERYHGETIASITSLRRYGYRGSIRVVTDDPDWMPAHLECETVQVPVVGDGFATRYYKTKLYEFGFSTTLFLDSDAIPIGDIETIWQCLGNSDLALAADLRPTVGELIARDRGDTRWTEEFDLMIRLGLTAHAFYNSGVMIFRKTPATRDLFASWHEEWKRFNGRDQMALTRALAVTAARVQALPVVWNVPARDFASIRDAQEAGAKVLHFFSSNRRFLTPALISALADGESNRPGGDWEQRDIGGRRGRRYRFQGRRGDDYRTPAEPEEITSPEVMLPPDIDDGISPY